MTLVITAVAGSLDWQKSRDLLTFCSMTFQPQRERPRPFIPNAAHLGGDLDGRTYTIEATVTDEVKGVRTWL
jgi:hypothetical protein